MFLRPVPLPCQKIWRTWLVSIFMPYLPEIMSAMKAPLSGLKQSFVLRMTSSWAASETSCHFHGEASTTHSAVSCYFYVSIIWMSVLGIIFTGHVVPRPSAFISHTLHAPSHICLFPFPSPRLHLHLSQTGTQYEEGHSHGHGHDLVFSNSGWALLSLRTANRNK